MRVIFVAAGLLCATAAASGGGLFAIACYSFAAAVFIGLALA